MPKHDVEMSIPTTKVVLSADVVFDIRSDDEKLGELRISKGTIDWAPSNAEIADSAELGTVRPFHARAIGLSTPPARV